MESRISSLKAFLISGAQSAKVWAEEDVVRSAACTIAATSLVIMFFRERSWSFLIQQQMQALDTLETDNRVIFDKLSTLSLQQSGNAEVDSMLDSCSKYCNCALDTTGHVKKPAPAVVYFGWTAVLQLLLLISVKLFENLNLYWCPNIAEGKAFNKQLLLKALNFLVKYSPISAVAFFLMMSLWCFVAWLGIVNRDLFVTNAFRWLLSLYIAIFIGYIVSNVAGAAKYIPSDWSTLSQNARELSWWTWLLGRAFGLNNMSTALNNMIWLGLLTWFIFPIRYFFYYRHASCANTEGNHIFFINTMGHCFLFTAACLLFYCPAVLLSLLDLQDMDLEDNKKPDNTPYLVKTFRNWVKLSSERLQGGWGDQQTMGLTTLFFIVSMVIYVLRFLYFLLTSGCTWYAWLMSWIFVHVHIGLVFFCMPGLNFLMQRLKVDRAHKQIFTANMIAKLIAPSEKNSEVATMAMDEKQAKMVSDRFYEGTMNRSLVFCYFNDTSALEKDEKSKEKLEKKSEEDDTDNVLTTVFKMVISEELADDEEAASDQQAEPLPDDAPSNEYETNQTAEDNID